MRLQNKISFLFLVISLFPLAIVGMISSKKGEEALLKQLGESFLQMARRSSISIEYNLLDIYNDVQTWSRLELMQEVLTGDVDGHISSFISDVKKSYGNYSRLEVINDQGIVVAATEVSHVDHDVSGSEFFIKNLGGKTYVSDVFFDKTDNQHVLVFSFPIWAAFASEPKVIGALTASWNVKQLSSIVGMTDLSSNESVHKRHEWLLRSDGVLIAAPADQQDGLFKRNVLEEGLESVKKASNGEEGFLVEKDSVGKEYLIAYTSTKSKNPNLPILWSSLVMQDTKEAFASLRQLSSIIFWAAALTFFVAAVLALAISQKLTRPIMLLSQVIGRVAGGDFKSRLHLPLKDEIGHLAKSFNAMAEHLEKTTVSRDDLLNEIDERKKAEARLKTLYDSSPLGIFLCDAKGKYEYVNTQYEKISSRSIVQAKGDGWIQGVYAADRNGLVTEWQRAVENQSRYTAEVRFMHADGTLLWTAVKADVIREEGVVTGFVGTVEDITDQKKTGIPCGSI